MSSRRWAIVLAVVVVLVLVPFACWVWPTPWRYDHWKERPVRTHRVTGQYEVLVAGGWLPVARRGPEEQFLARQRARRALEGEPSIAERARRSRRAPEGEPLGP